MARLSAVSASSRLWANTATNRIAARKVPEVYKSVPARAPGMRGKEEVERLARLEAQYTRVGQYLDTKI
ncbi:MAG: hypothetical protein ACXVDJ_05075 [Tumebacillaceae bacterium]